MRPTEHRPPIHLSRARRAFLATLALTAASCGLFSRQRTTAQLPPPRLPPPPMYLDQRAATGFMPPVRPPPPSRPAPTGPTILAAPFGASQAQGFFGQNPFGNLPLPTLPFAWPMMGLPGVPASAPFMAPKPPPRAARMPPRPGCGYVQVGGEQIPIDCPKPGYADILSAARPLLPDSIFRLSPAHAGAAPLPAAVDHREDGTEGPVRHQGSVGACSAFSFAAAIDHALARRSGRPWAVSVMHLWSRYHEPSMSYPVDNNRNRPLTSEDVWPYTRENQNFACSWVAKSRCKPNCGATDGCTCQFSEEHCGRDVDAEQLARADAYPIARVTAATRITQYDKETIMRALAQGQDIWMAMNFTYAAFDEDKLLPEYDGLRAVMVDFDPADATSTHAMVISGYRVRPTGTYFLVHNSWGEGWGDRGYVWVHETTMQANLRAAYLVDAEPWDPSSSKVPPRQEQPSQCPDGLLPDSITAQCTPPCADGSARHNAACAEPTDCPAGYVNLYGECVAAAPKVAGTDPTTGVRYACAAAGCSYVVPFGGFGCFMPWCSVSCPSPRFRLSGGMLGMACTE